MPEGSRADGTHPGARRRANVVIAVGAILTMAAIIATKDISRRNAVAFLSAEERYVMGVEVAILSVLLVEMLVRVVTIRLPRRPMSQLGTDLRIAVRIAGYLVGAACVVSILSSNPALGISIGTMAGVVVAFATQSTVGSVLATVQIISTRMVRVGEEITVSQTKGTILGIGLTHTVVSLGDDVAYVPNSLIVSSIVQRRKRNPDGGAGLGDW